MNLTSKRNCFINTKRHPYNETTYIDFNDGISSYKICCSVFLKKKIVLFFFSPFHGRSINPIISLKSQREAFHLNYFKRPYELPTIPNFLSSSFTNFFLFFLFSTCLMERKRLDNSIEPSLLIMVSQLLCTSFAQKVL